jgi:hypothetical protein
MDALIIQELIPSSMLNQLRKILMQIKPKNGIFAMQLYPNNISVILMDL